MTWSSELENDAQRWANELAQKDEFKHDQLDDVSLSVHFSSSNASGWSL